MISMLLLLISFAAERGHRYVTPSELARVLSAIHDVDWTEATEEDLQKLVPVTLTRSVAQIPADSIYRMYRCTDSVYLTYETANCSITLAFSKRPTDSAGCTTTLDMIRSEIEAPTTDAEAVRLAIIAALRAAGDMRGDFSEYQWRSDDSHTRFILEFDLMGGRESGLKRLNIRLSHVQVQPETVDNLPFHKGYFPPKCSKP